MTRRGGIHGSGGVLPSYSRHTKSRRLLTPEHTRSRRDSSEYSSSSGFSSSSSPDDVAPVNPWSYDDAVIHREMSVSSTSSPDARLQQKTANSARPSTPQRLRYRPASSSPIKPRPSTPHRLKYKPSSSSPIKVLFRVSEESDKTCLEQIFQPFVGLINTPSSVIDFIQDDSLQSKKWPLVLFGGCEDINEEKCADLTMPALGLVLLLQEQGIVGCDRLEAITQYFQRPPWKFHHSEWVAAHRVKAYPYNSLDYFYLADALPVCSVRQVHGGQEHLRLLRYVTHNNWDDTVNLYQLIIKQEPNYNKSDFCVFTVESQETHTIQFALKRLPPGIRLGQSCHATVSFQVTDIFSLLLLLPNASEQVSATCWLSTDFDGNEIFIEHIPRRRRQQKQRSRSHSRPRSQPSCKSYTTSFADVLLDTAQEFLNAENSSVFSEPYTHVNGLDRTPPKSRSKSLADAPLPHGTAALRTEFNRKTSTPVTNNQRITSRFSWVQNMLDLSNQSSVSGKTPSHHHTDSGFVETASEEGDYSMPGKHRQAHSHSRVDSPQARNGLNPLVNKLWEEIAGSKAESDSSELTDTASVCSDVSNVRATSGTPIILDRHRYMVSPSPSHSDTDSSITEQHPPSSAPTSNRSQTPTPLRQGICSWQRNQIKRRSCIYSPPPVFFPSLNNDGDNNPTSGSPVCEDIIQASKTTTAAHSGTGSSSPEVCRSSTSHTGSSSPELCRSSTSRTGASSLEVCRSSTSRTGASSSDVCRPTTSHTNTGSPGKVRAGTPMDSWSTTQQSSQTKQNKPTKFQEIMAIMNKPTKVTDKPPPTPVKPKPDRQRSVQPLKATDNVPSVYTGRRQSLHKTIQSLALSQTDISVDTTSQSQYEEAAIDCPVTQPITSTGSQQTVRTFSGQVHDNTYQPPGQVHGNTHQPSGQVHDNTYQPSGQVHDNTYQPSGQVHDNTHQPSGQVHDNTYQPSGQVHDNTHQPSGQVHDNTYQPSGQVHDNTYQPSGQVHDNTYQPPGQVHDNTYQPPGQVHDNTYQQPGQVHDNTYQPSGQVHDNTYQPPGQVHDNTYQQPGHCQSTNKLISNAVSSTGGKVSHVSRRTVRNHKSVHFASDVHTDAERKQQQQQKQQQQKQQQEQDQQGFWI